MRQFFCIENGGGGEIGKRVVVAGGILANEGVEKRKKERKGVFHGVEV